MVNDPEVQKGISHKLRQFTYEQELAWVNEKLNEHACIFSMLEKNSGEFIGNVEIMHINNNVGEIGISITASKQGKNYGTEAMKRIIEYGYDELKLDGFELNVYITNPKAIRCYEKVGFEHDGIGKTEDDIHMIYKR